MHPFSQQQILYRPFEKYLKTYSPPNRILSPAFLVTLPTFSTHSRHKHAHTHTNTVYAGAIENFREVSNYNLQTIDRSITSNCQSVDQWEVWGKSNWKKLADKIYIFMRIDNDQPLALFDKPKSIQWKYEKKRIPAHQYKQSIDSFRESSHSIYV